MMLCRPISHRVSSVSDVSPVSLLNSLLLFRSVRRAVVSTWHPYKILKMFHVVHSSSLANTCFRFSRSWLCLCQSRLTLALHFVYRVSKLCPDILLWSIVHWETTCLLPALSIVYWETTCLPPALVFCCLPSYCNCTWSPLSTFLSAVPLARYFVVVFFCGLAVCTVVVFFFGALTLLVGSFDP